MFALKINIFHDIPSLCVFLAFKPRRMEIRLLEFVEGAEKATGIAVIIDVFRAFTTACYLYHQGASEVLVTGDIDRAFSFRDRHPGRVVLAGERNEKKVEGFDLGNSPSEVLNIDLAGKRVVLTTSAGTKGLLHARNAERVLAASFVNAPATATFLKHQAPAVVSLVAMGYNAVIPADEDRLCAEYIRNLLLEKENDFESMERKIRRGTGRRFFDPENHHSPEADYHLAMQPGRFPWVLEALPSPAGEGLLLLKRLEP